MSGPAAPLPPAADPVRGAAADGAGPGAGNVCSAYALGTDGVVWRYDWICGERDGTVWRCPWLDLDAGSGDASSGDHGHGDPSPDPGSGDRVGPADADRRSVARVGRRRRRRDAGAFGCLDDWPEY